MQDFCESFQFLIKVFFFHKTKKQQEQLLNKKFCQLTGSSLTTQVSTQAYHPERGVSTHIQEFIILCSRKHFCQLIHLLEYLWKANTRGAQTQLKDCVSRCWEDNPSGLPHTRKFWYHRQDLVLESFPCKIKVQCIDVLA